MTCPLHGALSYVTTGKHQTDGSLGGVAGAIARRARMGEVMGPIRTNDR